MHVSENDLEILESMLDGELDASETAELQRRLQNDGDLSAALVGLQAERGARQQAWKSFEVSAARADALAERVLTRVDHSRFWAQVAWVGRLTGAAAACLLVGFGAGWYGRGLPQPASVDAPAVATSGGVTHDASGYSVELTDTAGHPIAVQRFPTLHEAMDFANDVNAWKSNRARENQPPVVPVSDPY
jgi:anti-sigma factor RsiW